MKFKMLYAAAIGAMLLVAPAVQAQTFVTSDGVLSIETPNDGWMQTADPNYWFVISDGKNSITIDHLSNGAILPTVAVANNNYPEIFQGFVSTLNEVFVVKAQAAEFGNLESLMKTVGTIKVLKPDTKTAISVTPAVQASEFSLRTIGQTYYVNVPELNVRTSCSTDSTRLGSLYLGDAVTVNGAVTQNGADYGWYQIQYNGSNAYVSAGFLSTEKPAAQAAAPAASNNTTTQNNTGSNQTSSNKGNPVGAAFTVTDAKGYDYATLTLYSDGLYYDQDGDAYTALGRDSYKSTASGVVVYGPDYLDIINAENGLYAVGSPIPVTDINEHGMGSLVPYSDGLFYDSTMEGYTSNGDGSYVGTLTGEVLFEYGYFGGDHDDYDDYDDYDDSITIHDGYGGAIEIYPSDEYDDFYEDEYGNVYMPGTNGEWHTSTSDDDVVYWE